MITIFTETESVDLARKEVEFIWERLEKQDEWFHHDILILAHIIFVFENETLELVANKLMNEMINFHILSITNALKWGWYLIWLFFFEICR